MRRTTIVLLIIIVIAAIAGFRLVTSSPTSLTKTAPTVLIVTRDLTIDDLSKLDPGPGPLALKRANIALINTVAPGPLAELSALLTIALGSHIPAQPHDGDIYSWDESNSDGRSTVSTFTARTGVLPNISRNGMALHLGIVGLERRGLTSRLPGAARAAAGLRPIRFLGWSTIPDETRRIAILATDGDGLLTATLLSSSDATREQILKSLKFESKDRLVIALPRDPTATHSQHVRECRELLLKIAATNWVKDTRIWLTSATADLSNSPVPDRLGLSLMWSSEDSGGTLVSNTTHTPGLISLVDIEPSLRAWEGVPFAGGMEGHAVSPAPSTNPEDLLHRLDASATLSHQVQDPLFLTLGVIAAVTAMFGFAGLSGWRLSGQAAEQLTRFLFTMPMAMLLTGVLHTKSVPLYVAGCLAMMGILTAISAVLIRAIRPIGQISVMSPVNSQHPTLISKSTPRTWLATVCTTTVLLIAADTLFGWGLIASSPWSDFRIPGIRFYGIGNETMGIGLGMAWLAMCLLQFTALDTALALGGLTLIMGLPALGADAGALVAGTVMTGMAVASLKRARLRFRGFVGWSILGFAIAFTAAWIDRTIGGAATHMGSAMASASEGGWIRLWEIIVRKAAMNARIMIHPALICTFLGLWMIAVVIRWRFGFVLQRLRERRPEVLFGLPAALWGGLAAFVFNDSGVVAAVFLVGPFLAAGFLAVVHNGEQNTGNAR